MTISLAIVIMWLLAGLVILSGYVRSAGWLMLTVAGHNVAYGSYLMSAA